MCKKQMGLEEFYYEKREDFQGTQLQLSIVSPYGNWKLSDSYLCLSLSLWDNMFPELFYIFTLVSEVWLLDKALLFASHFMWVCIKKNTLPVQTPHNPNLVPASSFGACYVWGWKDRN